MKKQEDFIYDLIFSEQIDFVIDISEYIQDVYKYDKFIDEIKKVLKKSKVSIIKEKVDVDAKTAILEFKSKKIKICGQETLTLVNGPYNKKLYLNLLMIVINKTYKR
jgi:hypothetical protein